MEGFRPSGHRSGIRRPASSRSSSRSTRSSSVAGGSYRGRRDYSDGNHDAPLDPIYEYRDERGRRNNRQFSYPEFHAFDTKENDERFTGKQIALLILALFLFVAVVVIISLVVVFVIQKDDSTRKPTDSTPSQPPVSEIKYIVTSVSFTFDIQFLPEYYNPASTQYIKLKRDITEAVNDGILYRELELNGIYNRADVNKFSPGSVIADISIYLSAFNGFFPSDSSLSEIRQQLETILQTAIDSTNGPFADLEVVENSLEVRQPTIQYVETRTTTDGSTTRERRETTTKQTTTPTRTTPTTTKPKTTTKPSTAAPSPTTTKKVQTTEEDASTTIVRGRTDPVVPTTPTTVPGTSERKTTERQTTTTPKTTTVSPTTTTSQTTTKPSTTTTATTTKKPTATLPPTTTTVQTTTLPPTTVLKDTDAPTVTCPGDIIRETEEGEDSIEVSWKTPSVSDAFDPSASIALISTHEQGSRFYIGDSTVIYTAIDQAGNQGHCYFTVTIIDVEPPIIFCPSDMTVTAERGEPMAEVTWSSPFASDNSRWISDKETNYEPGSSFPTDETTEVVYTVHDRSDNKATCSFSVTVLVNNGPDIECPQDIDRQLDQGADDASITWTEPTPTDDDGVKSVDSDYTSGSMFPIGTTTITYTAVDNNNEVTMCSFRVTVIDKEKPELTCPADISQNTDPNTAFATINLPDATTSDNSGIFTVVNDAPAQYTIRTSWIVTFTATDESGNFRSCSVTVTVIDNQPPSIDCPDGITASTNTNSDRAYVTLPDASGLSDNSGQQVTWQTDLPSQAFPIGDTLITYTASDSSGNEAKCSFTVTVQDMVDPVIECPNNFEVSTDPSSTSATLTLPDPETLSDNSGLDVTLSGNVPIVRILPIGDTTVTYTATDFYGNMAQCNFTITVKDMEDPSITCPGDVLIQIPIDSSTTTIQQPDPSDVGDNAGGNIILGSNWPSGGTFSAGSTEVMYTAMDTSGNEAMCTFNVIVEVIADFAANCPSSITTDTDPGQPTANVVLPDPTVVNNPGGSVAISNDAPQQNNFPIGVNTVTVTATASDESVATCTITVTVNDNEDPTIQCPGVITVPTDPGLATTTLQQPNLRVGDNSQGDIIVGSDWPTDGVFPLQVTRLTLMATDPSGNQAICSVTVIVEDREDPVIVCPHDFEVSTDPSSASATVTLPDPQTLSDNTGLDVTLSGNDPVQRVLPIGDADVVYVATDIYGYEAECSFTITVRDTEDPTILCPGYILARVPDVSSTVTIQLPDPSKVNDNSGENIIPSNNWPADETFSVGSTVIMYTATDAAGNEDTCTFSVTIQVIEQFAVNCPSPITRNTDSGQPTANVMWPSPTVINNPGGSVTFTDDASAGKNFPIGVNMVTMTATASDESQDTCAFTVTVNDQENPVVACPADFSRGYDSDVGGAVVFWPPGFSQATDNSEMDIGWTYQPESGSTLMGAGDHTITFTATDIYGNWADCTFVVEVKEPVVEMDSQVALDMEFIPAYNDLNSQESQDLIAAFTSQMDETFKDVPDYGGYNGNSIRPGSTVVEGELFFFTTMTSPDEVNEVIVDEIESSGGSFGQFDTSADGATILPDTEPPVIVCPDDIYEIVSDQGDAVTLQMPYPNQLSDNFGNVTLTSNWPEDNEFVLGVVVVTYTASDPIGNEATCRFAVTILLDVCDSDQFLCYNGTCIPNSWECDGIFDCILEEDEERNCPCSNFEFTCEDNTCIPKAKLCNGIDNCLYGEDENCGGAQFTCDDGLFIPYDWKCDNINHCPSGIDEINCTCDESDFVCENGQCVPADWLCDDIEDCLRSEDETNCTCVDYEFECYDDCGILNIYLEPGNEVFLTSKNYPSNYEDDLTCQWVIQAAFSSVLAETQDFHLARADYLYIGTNGFDSPSRARYTKDGSPPVIVSAGEFLYIGFKSDSSLNDTGFSIRLSATNDTYTTACSNGIEILPASVTCNGSVECYDKSDEQFCNLFETGVCGTRPAFNPNIRVVGGVNAPAGSWPWICTIHNSGGHGCGCTLIDEEWAITAAHCVESEIERTVRIGVVKLDEKLSEEVEKDVIDVIIHPDYDPGRSTNNDIALLHLSSPVEFSDYVIPACLAVDLNETAMYTGDCMIAGWGETEGVLGSSPNHLQQVNVPLISSESCASDFLYRSEQITEAMICAGEELGGIDACQGDSGGPLVCEDEGGIWHLVGITSLGGGCADAGYPGVYARVAWFQDFILNTVNGVDSGLCRRDEFQCDNGQCLPSCWNQCDFISQCQDGSDELDCDTCPDPEIIVPRNLLLSLPSYGYPIAYENNMKCLWTVQCEEGSRRILVEFVDFNLETYYDYLHIGTADSQLSLFYTGFSLPALNVLSPANGALYFRFETDNINVFSGFLLNITCTDDEDFTLCPGNGLEVLDDSSWICNDNVNCQDGSDEADQLCDCGDSETTNIADGEAVTLEYLGYDNNALCQWTFSVPEDRYTYIQFDTFSTEQCCDYLYFGNEGDFTTFGRYSGFQQPNDFIVSRDTVVVTFYSDSNTTSEGFVIRLTTVDPADTIECSKGFGAVFEDEYCDGLIGCTDGSDERWCPPCYDVPQVCASFLSYNRTYFPNSVSRTQEKASAIFANAAATLNSCHDDAMWLLCATVYPQCQEDSATETPCRQECNAVIDNCPEQFAAILDGCENLPNITEVSCFLPEGDIHGGGICGSMPAIEEQRIVDGNDAEQGSWPWIGSLTHIDLGHFCGANLIGENWAVTAAHCVGDLFTEIYGDFSNVSIVFGDNDLEDTSGYEQVKDIDNVIMHPEYNGVHNDIALLHLSDPVTFTDNVRPICLTRSWEEIDSYQQCWIAGWGRLYEYGDPPTVLQEVEAPLITQEDCIAYYEDNGYAYLAPPDTEICAGYLGNGPGICSGDSGGPLACIGADNRWHLIGITSKVPYCGEWPSLYTRISRFYTFIETYTRRAEGCYSNEFTCDDGECIEGSWECDNFIDCDGGEDEINCGCYSDEFTCDDGKCIEGSWECDNYIDCGGGEDEINCDRGDSEITYIADGEAVTLEYLSYDNYAFCQWTFSVPEDRYMYIQFDTFSTEQCCDYLYFGNEGDFTTFGRYSGFQQPNDFIVPRDTVVVTFYSDFSETSEGFVIRLTTVDPADTFECSDGFGAVFEDEYCDGLIGCTDGSDERWCPPCYDVPQVCASFLSYNRTYFPNDLSQTQKEASAIFDNAAATLNSCHDDAMWLLCATVYPQCQEDSATETPCRQECNAAIDNCPEQFAAILDGCENLPNITEVSCFLPEGDIHGGGICGSRPAIEEQRIVDGNDAEQGSWPWIGSLTHIDLGHFCGANLIGENWAVTAAHCVGDLFTEIYGDFSNVSIVFGDNDLEDTSGYEQVKDIDNGIMHPEYNGVHNDIALLHLSDPVTFTDYVRPICLTRSWEEIDSYQQCWIAGWGRLYEYGDPPTVLQEVEAPLITQEDCIAYYEDTGYAYLAPPDTEICAGYLGNGPGICSGDSGGPLACIGADNRWHLIGITSKAPSCGEWPALYTRISRFYTFIETYTKRAEDSTTESSTTVDATTVEENTTGADVA